MKMIRHGFENIKNVFNPVEGKLHQIIEYFVMFYGERYRTRIEEKLNNTFFIFYDRKDTIVLEGYFQSLKDILAGEFYEEFAGCEKGSFLEEKYSYQKLEYYLKQIAAWKKKIVINDADNIFNFLKCHHQKKLLTDDFENFKLRLKEESFNKKLKEVFEEFESLYKYCYQDDLEYLTAELARMNCLLPDDSFQKLEEQFENQVKDTVAIMLIKFLKIEITCDNVEYLDSIAMFLMDFFATKEDFLLNKDLTKYQDIKNKLYSISNYHVQDLKELSQEQRKQCIDNLIDYPLELVKNKLKELQKEKNKKLSRTRANFDDVYKLINDRVAGKNAYKNLVDMFKENILSKDAYTMVCPGLPDENKSYSIVFCNSILKMLDSVLIHELNHVVSSFASAKRHQLEGCNECVEIFCKIGFVTKTFYENHGKFKCSTWQQPDYTALNEAINEFLAQKISSLMLDDGFQIGLHKTNEDKVCSYSYDFPLLKSFFENNLEDIIMCNMADDETLLFQKFGKGNIDLLAQAVYNYSELRNSNYDNYKDFVCEVKARIGEFDGFKCLNCEFINWSENASKFLQCFAIAEKANKQIILFKETINEKILNK